MNNEKENYICDDKVSILNAIVDLIASKENSLEIFRDIRNYLKTIIPCDYITILFNNEQARYFYIISALNILQRSVQDEITIPYHETSLTEILRTRAPLYRPDLKSRGNLTPGDLKFLSHGISSDLSVPIVCKNRVKAVLNLSSYKRYAFNDSHQLIVEEVAILLSLSLERIELANELRDMKQTVNQWKEKYKTLLENTDNAIAVISSDNEMIYETNKAFQKLTGYPAQQLHGMRFAKLHPTLQHYVFNNIIKETTHGKIGELNDLILLKNDGLKIHVNIKFVKPVTTEEKPLFFTIYQDLTVNRQLPETDYHKIKPLTSILHSGTELLTKSNLESIPTRLLNELGLNYHAKYVVLHLVSEESSELTMYCARTVPFENHTQIPQPLIMGLYEGPYQQVIEKNEIIKFNDISAYQWFPVAQKLGYRSLICLPLMIRQKTLGVLSLFFEDERSLTNEEILVLKCILNYFSMIIENYNIQNKLQNTQQLISISNEITNLLNADLDLKEIVRITATESKKIIDFDYFLITMFNDSIDYYDIFAIASKTYSKLFNQEFWEPLRDADLGWLNISVEENNDNGKTAIFDKWPHKLQSKINALLLARNKYLGTITLASLEPEKYNRLHQNWLNHIACQIAIAIENTRLFKEENKKLADLASLVELSRTLNTNKDLDQVSKTIIPAVSNATNAKSCTVRYIENDSVLTDAEKNGFVIREINDFIPQIVKSLSPLYIENLKIDQHHSFSLSINSNNDSKDYCSYLGVPIISRGQVIAVISVYWGERHRINETVINLISIIANQAASAIENARLHREILRNSNDFTKVNQELENFVYTMSHELKSPIASIKGFTSIMLNELQTYLGEEHFYYLKRIQSNANRIEDLINDLLELSRIGRGVNPFEDVNVDDIISQILNEHIYHIESNKIKLIVDKNLPTICCDKKGLSQVFSNLIENAIKYSGENNPAPRIEIGYKDEIANYLFYIKDNGIGIPQEYHHKIFELFQRVNPMDSDDYSMGIGLAIVKKIIEHHNGKIWVDSETGSGATFFFTIPKKEN